MPDYRFAVRTAVNPQSLPRVLEFFAQRDLTPRTIRTQIAQDELTITIEQADLAANVADLIAEKMRSSVLVSEIDLVLL